MPGVTVFGSAAPPPGLHTTPRMPAPGCCTTACWMHRAACARQCENGYSGHEWPSSLGLIGNGCSRRGRSLGIAKIAHVGNAQVGSQLVQARNAGGNVDAGDLVF